MGAILLYLLGRRGPAGLDVALVPAGDGLAARAGNLAMTPTASLQNAVERAQALRAKARRTRADAERAATKSRDMWEHAQKVLEETRDVVGRAEDRTARGVAPNRESGNAAGGGGAPLEQPGPPRRAVEPVERRSRGDVGLSRPWPR